MKIRMGFVSNSSSSSFLVLQKKPELSQTEIDALNKDFLIKQLDYDDDDKFMSKQLKRYKNRVIVESGSVGNDTDTDAFEKVMTRILKAFNAPTQDISFEWEDC